MKAFLAVIVAAVSATAGAVTRPPAVAGSFYTKDPAKLRAEVEQLLGSIEGRMSMLASTHGALAEA